MPDISVSIGANNAQLNTVLNACVNKIASLGKSATSALSPVTALLPELAAAAGLGAGFAGIAFAMGGVITKGRELAETMARTGASGENILQLQKAFKMAGMDAEGVAPSIAKLQKSLAGMNEDGDDTSGVFGQLGMNIQALKGMNPAEQFAAIGQAIRGLQDPAERTQAVWKIFGKSGAEMLQLFNNADASSALTAGLSRSQQLLARNAGMYAHMSKTVQGFMGQLKSSFGLFSGLTAGIAPALDGLLSKLPKLDLTKLGQQLGNMAGLLIQAFSDGKLGELVGNSLKVGIAEAANALYSVVQGVGGALAAVVEPLGAAFKYAGMMLLNLLSGAINGIGSALGAYLSLAANVLTAEFSNFPTYIGAFKDGLIGAIQLAGALLLTIFQKPIIAFQTGLDEAVQNLMAKLAKVPGISKMFGLGDFKPESHEEIATRHQQEGATMFGSTASDLQQKGEANMAKAGQGMKDTFKDVDIKGGVAEVGNQFKEGFKNGNLFDKKDTDAAKAAVDPATFGNKLAQGYKNGQKDAKPLVNDKAEKGGLNAVVNQLAGKMSEQAGKYVGKPPTGTNQLEKTDEEKGRKEKKETVKDDFFKTNPISSLAKIGGAGSVTADSTRALMQQHTAYLKQIAQATQAALKKDERKQALGHSVANAPGASAFA